MPVDLSLRFRVVLALVGAVLLLAVSVLLVNYGIGAFDGHYTLTATFGRTESVAGLDTNSDVKVRGVTIGRVGKIQLLPDGRTRLKLRIDSGAKVADTSEASVEPLSIFGSSYVNVTPGAHETSGPFLAHGVAIPNTHVSTSFSHLLASLGGKLVQLDTDSLRTVVHTVAQGMAGLGPQFAQILDNSSTIVDVAMRHLPQAQQFLTDVTGLSQTLVDHSGSIVSTVNNLNDVLPVITTRGDALGRLLDSASQLSGALSSYIGDHAAAFGRFVDAASHVLDVAYRQVPNFTELITVVGQFFKTLGDAMRLPAPDGFHLIGALHGGVLDTLCVNIPINLPLVCDHTVFQ
jgi:virulence factor Mce-like protein